MDSTSRSQQSVEDRILDRFAKGFKPWRIATVVNLPAAEVWQIIQAAEAAGDPRAHGAIKANDTPPEVLDAVLDMWAAGTHWREISEKFGFSKNKLLYIAYRVRLNGDMRGDQKRRKAAVKKGGPLGVPDAPRVSNACGLEPVTRTIPNQELSYSTSGASHVSISLPRLRCLEGAI